MYDSFSKPETFVQCPILCVSCDNPKASEICPQLGSTARHFCRDCDVSFDSAFCYFQDVLNSIKQHLSQSPSVCSRNCKLAVNSYTNYILIVQATSGNAFQLGQPRTDIAVKSTVARINNCRYQLQCITLYKLNVHLLTTSIRISGFQCLAKTKVITFV